MWKGFAELCCVRSHLSVFIIHDYSCLPESGLNLCRRSLYHVYNSGLGMAPCDLALSLFICSLSQV